MRSVVKWAKMARSVPAALFADPNFKKLSYVRYADDWVIGIRGSYKETQVIYDQVRTKLAECGLTLSESKTKITNLNDSKFLFLGTDILIARQTTFSRQLGILQRNPRKLRLQAPIQRILAKLREAGFTKDGDSYPKFVWMSLEHRQILHMYNAVLRGFLNYYSFAHNYGQLASRLNFVLKDSCAKLLAAKFSLGTKAKIYKKFGSESHSRWC